MARVTGRAVAPRALRVGLTGSLAAGKSTVLAIFRGRGAATIDADQLAREALAPGSPLLGQVRTVLGDTVFWPDGALDRTRVAELVFADPERRRALEAIVHPAVIAREEALVTEHAAAGATIVVADIPLLFEVGRETVCDRVVAVICPEPLQLERAVARGMAEADARRRIANQMPASEKAARADYVVDTSGTIADTRARALAVWAELEHDAARLRSGQPLERRRG